jgi:hypothetical protein
MSLQEKLDAQRGELESSVPGELMRVMHKATEELEKSDLPKQAKGEGDQAPEFTLKNAQGREVSLSAKLSQGPVVLGFYRGRW